MKFTDEWMPVPEGPRPPNCPPGLEYLAMIDQLKVHQMFEPLEVVVGWESENKFTIKNNLGQKVYVAAEISDSCSRQMCGSSREFDIEIRDADGKEVIHLFRPLNCLGCCFPSCLQTISVFSPPGKKIGSIQENWTIAGADLSIKDAVGKTVMKIEGPVCPMASVSFDLMTLDRKQVGKIHKKWTGLTRELFTDADNFDISFPMDLDVKMKAVILGACFLIVSMERKELKENYSAMIGWLHLLLLV